jgi:hypothetical protein
MFKDNRHSDSARHRIEQARILLISTRSKARRDHRDWMGAHVRLYR